MKGWADRKVTGHKCRHGIVVESLSLCQGTRHSVGAADAIRVMASQVCCHCGGLPVSSWQGHCHCGGGGGGGGGIVVPGRVPGVVVSLSSLSCLGGCDSELWLGLRENFNLTNIRYPVS